MSAFQQSPKGGGLQPAAVQTSTIDDLEPEVVQTKARAGQLSSSLIRARYGAPARAEQDDATDDLPPLQALGGAPGSMARGHAVQGVQGQGGPLPYLDVIQASFGHHDLGGAQAHTGGDAAEAAGAMGAQAFTMGRHVAFRGQPDLHTAAHEAAHVVQQQRGVKLKGGVGEQGDAYEQQADTAADRVVAGQSAEPVLDQPPGGGGHAQPGAAPSLGKEGDISSFVDGVIAEPDEDEESEDSQDRAEVDAMEGAEVPEAGAEGAVQLKASSSVLLQARMSRVQTLIVAFLSQASAADHQYVVSTWQQCRAVVNRIKGRFPHALGRVIKVFDHCMDNDYNIGTLLSGLQHLERNLQGYWLSKRRKKALRAVATNVDLHRALQSAGPGVPKASALPAHQRRNPEFMARFAAYVSWRKRHYDQFILYLTLLEQRGYRLAGGSRAHPVLVRLMLNDREVYSGTFEGSESELKRLLSGADSRLILNPHTYVSHFLQNDRARRLDGPTMKALRMYSDGMSSLEDRWPSTSYVAQCFGFHEEHARKFDPTSPLVNHFNHAVAQAHEAYLRAAGRESMGHDAFEKLLDRTGSEIRQMLAFARAKHDSSFGQGAAVQHWLVEQQADSSCLLSCWA